MVTRIHQRTRIPRGSGIKVNNDFRKKQVHVNKIPLGSTIRVDKSFIKPENLKQRMSKIKASPKYKAGEAKVRAKLTAIKVKKGSTVTIKNRNVKMDISTS